MDEYITNYRSLYNIINVVSKRMDLNLTTDLYEGIESHNLGSLIGALKNNYPSTEQLFKKFPIRHFHFIDPQSKATMKSLTKHLEENKLCMIQKEVDEWIVSPCASPEMMIESKMKIMAVFHKLIETIRKKALFSSVDDRLRNQISANRELSAKIADLTKEGARILNSKLPPYEKVMNLLNLIDSVKDKKEVLEIVLQLVNEWIPDMDLAITQDQICRELRDNTEVLQAMNEILSNLRLIPFDAKSQKNDMNLLSRVIQVLNAFVDNSIVVPQSMQVNICRLINTLRVGLGDSVAEITKTRLPLYKDIVAEVKRCYSIDLSNGGGIKKNEDVEPSIPLLIEFIDRIVVKKEVLSLETILSYLGDLPETRMNVYKNLEKHNISWSDEYFQNFYSEVIALFQPTK